MSKHTPEPLEIEREHGGHSITNRTIESDDWCITAVYGKSNTSMANTNLIAAAPDLLEALENSTSDLFYQIKMRHGAEAASKYPSIIEARSAIAKARGEA